MIVYEMNKYEFFDTLLKIHGSDRMPYSRVGCDLIFNHISDNYDSYSFSAAAIRGEYTEWLNVMDLFLDTCSQNHDAANRLYNEYCQHLQDGYIESAAIELTVACRVHEHFIDLNTYQTHIIGKLS